MSADTELKQSFARYQVRYSTACYLLDGSPLHLWTIWRWCRWSGISTPAFVLRYLDDVADQLDPTSPHHERKGRIEDWTRQAVLGDSKAPADTPRGAKIVQRALRVSPELDLSDDERFELADQLGVDEHTIRRWVDRWRKVLDDGE